METRRDLLQSSLLNLVEKVCVRDFRWVYHFSIQTFGLEYAPFLLLPWGDWNACSFFSFWCFGVFDALLFNLIWQWYSLLCLELHRCSCANVIFHAHLKETRFWALWFANAIPAPDWVFRRFLYIVGWFLFNRCVLRVPYFCVHSLELIAAMSCSKARIGPSN